MRLLLLALLYAIVGQAADIPPLLTGTFTSPSAGFAVLPDIQFETQNAACDNVVLNCIGGGSPGDQHLHNMMSDILAKRVSQNIQVVMSVGDITNFSHPLEWQVAKTEFGRLISAGIKVVTVHGNHDTDTSSPSMASYDDFSETLYRPGGVPVPWVYDWIGTPSFGYQFVGTPVSKSGHWMAVAYQVTMAGKDILILALPWECGTSTAYQAWATNTQTSWLALHPTGRVWALTHEVGWGNLNQGAGTAPRGSTWTWAYVRGSFGQAIYDNYIANLGSKVEAIYFGHATAQTHAYTVSNLTAPLGKRVWEFFANFQGVSPPGPTEVWGLGAIEYFAIANNGNFEKCSYFVVEGSYDYMGVAGVTGVHPVGMPGSTSFGVTGAITSPAGYSCMRDHFDWPAVETPATHNITVKHQNGTATIYTESQLQNAIDDPLTACGDIIEIDPGAARHGTNPIMLRGPALAHSLGGPLVAPTYAKDCNSSRKYITLRSSKAYQLTPGKRVDASDAANLAFIGAVDSTCTVIFTEPGASFYRLHGLELAASTLTRCNYGGGQPILYVSAVSGGGSAMARLDLFPHNIIIDQSWVHGIDSYAVRDGAILDGNNIALINSTIDNIRTDQDESHGFISYAGYGPLVIRNNNIASGSINSIFGGAASAYQGGTGRPSWITYDGNHLYKLFKWMDWSGAVAPNPTSPCPLDADGHGATYRDTADTTYWECQGPAPGTWTQLADAATYNALIAVRVPVHTKNLWEVKNGSHITLSGNVLENDYGMTFAGQAAACFLSNIGLVTRDAAVAHLIVENNRCTNASSGMGLAALSIANGDIDVWENAYRSEHDIVFKNNYFSNMGAMSAAPFGDQTGWYGGSKVNTIGGSYLESITLDHNTFDGRLIGGGATNLGVTMENAFRADIPSRNQRITNSIWSSGNYPLAGLASGGVTWNAVAVDWGLYAEMAANSVLLTSVIDPYYLTAMTQHCEGPFLGCPYLTDRSTPPPNCLGCTYLSPTESKFTAYPDDLTLASDSPLKARGLDGKDIGADLSTVGWATSGATSGTLSPYLTMKIRSTAPTTTTVVVRFSAPDTTSCTVEARLYGFPLASPVATATVNTGNLDRTATLTGLTTNTRYGLKVTCAGSYYRERAFRTP